MPPPNPRRLTVGGTNTIWTYRNMPAVARKLDPPGKHDACYLPRQIHVTDNIDIHEMVYAADVTLSSFNARAPAFDLGVWLRKFLGWYSCRGDVALLRLYDSINRFHR